MALVCKYASHPLCNTEALLNKVVITDMTCSCVYYTYFALISCLKNTYLYNTLLVKNAKMINKVTIPYQNTY